MSDQPQVTPRVGESAVLTTPSSEREPDIYKQNVFRLMDTESSLVISNGQPLHAAALFEAFFRYAKSEVKILCKNLSKEVFDHSSLVGAFQAAVKRGVGIQIIVQGPTAADSEFMESYRTLEKASYRNVTVVENASTKSSVVKERKENFAVMDGRAFRYEGDSSQCKAAASMNCPDLAKQLCSIFDRIASSVASSAT